MSSPAAQHDAWIALGGNMDDPAAQVRSAMDALDAIRSTRVVRRSSLYRSAPWGYADQNDFVNAVVRVVTALSARELLAEMLSIERLRGRVRTIPNGPRILDLDLLLYDGASIDEPDLVVPHPRMHERAFVLAPLAEIDPGLTVPGIGVVTDLLRRVDTGGLELLAHA
jgi:2-amino-4-hydroxy-6-hydroxymethyldihydropteridine diphosphokinase